METTQPTTRKHPRTKRSDDMNALMEKCQVFWAFSNKQFDEGRTKLNLVTGEKLIDIGAGGFMPAKHKQEYIDGMKAIYIEFKAAMKDAKTRRAHILYELNNHEAFYSRDIESTLDALGDDFTRDEVMAVYKAKK